VGVLVEGALIFAAIRFRRRPHDGLPSQIHGSTKVEITWTSLPAIVLLFILFPTIKTIFETQAPAPSGSYEIHVIGHQFWWEFQYPDSGVVTADEVHMPVDRTINFQLNSDDVIHSFWVPALGGKRDAFPQHTNYIWLTPDKVGQFPGQCYQLCGYSHGNMRMTAFVQTEADFEAWLSAQQQPAVTPAPGTDAAQGAQLFATSACIGCHTINGTAFQGRVGPNLTHVASRTTIAGGVLPNTTAGLHAWLKDPPAIKPGSIMPDLKLNDEQIRLLTAYLQSLT
jgi:cytochrome c oxidase subunit 2